MPKVTKFLLIIAILFASMSYLTIATAQVYIYNVEVFDMQNGSVKIYWETVEPTQARVYLGESSNNLDKFYFYSQFDSAHVVTFMGLQKDVTYYFKIVAVNKAGGIMESFLQTFSTKNMIDTVAPEFSNAQVTQTTKDAAAVSWTTNEETKAEIFYGTREYDLNKKAGYGSYNKYHEIFLYNLTPETYYFVKIIAEDRGKNKQISFLNFKTAKGLDKNTALKIYQIEPANFDGELVHQNKVTLKWKTNFVAKSKIHYGLESGKYNKHADVLKDSHALEYEFTIEALEPNVTYYYKIEVYDSFYGKKVESGELTFTTSAFSAPTPQIKDIQAGSEYFDSDNDGLSDIYEYEIGTDPLKQDSDGDGYNDGNEMKHGWDPNVFGSTAGARLQAANYYLPKRNYQYRVEKDRELRIYVNNRLGSPYVASKNWRILSDAYIYGGYPAEAIVTAIKHGGKTVHPTIPWSVWKKTSVYQQYINR
ncbi:hypothetical protein COZ84_01420 [Candidatus Kuenenbacteria bacterium CG_4_8_14_3_um_filter_39_15]|uniref:Fibronectin type-III domain-containing protein n=1 Tax=Candidatus Kuenenbacteria bacterium CG_4_8_14_3_um_filter_39_15 TaxID=1974615 RepID=A0A2M7ILT0_9BACT|nr:MAG: hypothetical protein COZ84_01420 [Candidatus Kuenenbacteria bacterium CG_4_8_14_3_um_filter_39_15]